MLNNCHLSQLVHSQAQRFGGRAVLSRRDNATGRWPTISWRDFSAMVRRVSLSLLSLDVAVQERVAVFAQNMPECFYASFGAYGVRATVVPFYATSSGAQAAYMVNDAEVRVIFVGEQEQYDVVMSVAAVCPTLEHIVIFDSGVRQRADDCMSMRFDEFLGLADEGGHEATLQERAADISFDDLADILYTSGTTGASKGVMMTYAMYREAFRANARFLPLTADDVALNFLPFTHVFERAWSYFCLAVGARLAVNHQPTEVLRSMQEVHPTCMCAVPRFWEKVYQGVQERLETTSPLERRLIRDALATGNRYWADYRSRGLEPPLALRLKHNFYNRTIVSLLRRTLGLERANFFPTAGATVSPEIEKFVHAAGIHLIVGYGLTESTATVSCDMPGRPCSLGSVGRIIEGLELKFGENNEILLRGKTITPGYYRKETTTKAAIDAEGWFHTGDAGYIKDGELYLTERIKDLFKTSNGKYIAPQAIESKFVFDRYIDQAVVVADQRKFVSALVVPNYALLRRFAEQQGLSAADNAALCALPQVHDMMAERIETLQQDLAHYEKVKRFILLPEPFTIAGGELTNTLKVRRAVVYERYAEAIDQLYAQAEAEHPHPLHALKTSNEE